ncbi:tripartite tricarboxylate transporter TctB family protein [Pseudomonas lopnurensis]|uniref:tripartite tricarboxylate transporter TctB family protein n=1 Tax=Pseudomonas lopnurensis TaxID=1477517 RepID=UPI0028AEB787|nr:tripartite tricarboxylate transporter TctB family protein [Pseudomonas lopnurensis]
MKTKSALYKDLVGTAIALALVAAYYVAAGDIPRSSLIGKGVGADALPRGLGFIAGILCLILLAQNLWPLLKGQYKHEDKPTPEKRRESQIKHLRAAGMLLIGIVYLWVFQLVGWPVSIFALLVATALYSGRPFSMKLLAFGAIVTVSFWLLFVVILEISMPMGILEPLTHIFS